MSQDVLAAKLGKSRSLVSQWEKGRTRLPANDVTSVAEALNCSVDYLFDPKLPAEVQAQAIDDTIAALEEHLLEITTSSHAADNLYKKQVAMLLSTVERLSTEDRQRALRMLQALAD